MRGVGKYKNNLFNITWEIIINYYSLREASLINKFVYKWLIII